MGATEKILLFGYGNPGRGDDGLGPALAAAIEEMGIDDVVVDANYQLNLEDASEIGGYSAVVFADAAAQGPSPFWFSRIDASAIDHVGWTSHSVSPAQVVALARDLFESQVPAYTLGIRGYDFGELDESLSGGAQENLAKAIAFVRTALADRQFERYAREFGYTTSAASSGPNNGSSTWKA
jgi:hydrogenase maturation protease